MRELYTLAAAVQRATSAAISKEVGKAASDTGKSVLEAISEAEEEATCISKVEQEEEEADSTLADFRAKLDAAAREGEEAVAAEQAAARLTEAVMLVGGGAVRHCLARPSEGRDKVNLTPQHLNPEP